MNRNRSKSRVARTMPLINPNAAAIDVGATITPCSKSRELQRMTFADSVAAIKQDYES
jgi:hypothetical protein